jgi:hypothetical protein
VDTRVQQEASALSTVICQSRLDQFATAKANGYNDVQAKRLSKLSTAEFVKQINDMVLPKGKTKKMWIFNVSKAGNQ